MPTDSATYITAVGGMSIDVNSKELDYLIRENIIKNIIMGNCQRVLKTYFKKKTSSCNLDGILRRVILLPMAHMTHELEPGDEIIITPKEPPLLVYVSCNN